MQNRYKLPDHNKTSEFIITREGGGTGGAMDLIH